MMKTWQKIVLALVGIVTVCLVGFCGSAFVAAVIESRNYGLIGTDKPTESAQTIATPEPTTIPLPTNTLAPTATIQEPTPTTQEQAQAITPIPSLTPITPGPAAATSPASCLPPQEPQKGIVTKVIDGDTIEAAINNQSFTIRYIGMDAPEIFTGPEPGGQQATQLNTSLVLGQSITLYRDKTETDKYGRLLRYVFVGNKFINAELVRQGLAIAKDYPPDTACSAELADAQGQAQQASLGVWGGLPQPTVQPRQATVPAVGGNCDPAYPDVCIPSPPPDLNCKNVPYTNFRVLPPDPHNFDGNGDGRGCEPPPQ